MSIEYRKTKKDRVLQTASREMARMTRMTSHENPASSVVEFTRLKKENAQCGITNAVNVEEEITLHPNARNLESA